VIELEDGKSLLKLTTASYQRPNGHNIHRFPDSKETDEWGVSPNKGFEVRMTDGEMVQWMAERRVHDILLGKKAGDKTAAIAGDPNARHPEAHPLPRDVADSKRSDRQMQKALDYLSTELARAK